MSKQQFNLNAQQREAVEYDGHCLVSAVPGSGKSRILASRAAALLDRTKHGGLAAVTFTKDAAGELAGRIVAQCDKKPGKRLMAGTFHSLALLQVKKIHGRINVLEDNQRFAIMRRIYERIPQLKFQKIQFEDVCQQVDIIKSSLEPPPGINNNIGLFYKEYQDCLRKENSMDFSDLILSAVRAMKAGDIDPLPINWLLVDEAQDMDSVQYEWIKCHSRAGIQVTMVADDDQSIYGWRNALGYEGLMAFVRQHRAHQIVLGVNYRSRPEILSSAIKLIGRNKNRVKKSITPFKQEAGSVKVVKVLTKSEETLSIARKISEAAPEDRWAVLARTNKQLDPVELILRSRGISCNRVGGKSFWENKDPAMYLGLLRSLARDTGGGAVTALHWAGIHSNALDFLHENPPRTGSELVDILNNISKEMNFDDKAERQAILNFAARYKEWQTALSLNRIRLVVSGVARWCESRGTIKGKKKNNKASIFSYCEEALIRMRGPLEQRILFLTQETKKDNDAQVTLMTLHSSKGLEFPNVWIVGAEDGITPHAQSKEENNGDVSEERRLFYVGMTRAENHLVISYTVDEATPSPFIDEAGLATQTLG